MHKDRRPPDRTYRTCIALQFEMVLFDVSAIFQLQFLENRNRAENKNLNLCSSSGAGGDVLCMPFPTPAVISHLGKSLLRSTSCSEELVHFFYFSLGFDGANTISDPENSLNLSSALTICLTDCLCLAGLTRDRATIACHEMLADAHQIENTLPAKEHMNSTNSMNSTYSMNSSNSMNNMDLQELLNLC